ncbi:MAG: glycosyltransferase [Actinobacteria bacterium]|nr:MAG: glycosyltransferase [Actinomycetota bacterium]
MLIADSHEFIELYRGDKDLRVGMEMLKVAPDIKFVSFAPDKASPNDRERFGRATLQEIGLPELPERFALKLLESKSIRFAQKESGGIVSWMPGYGRALAATAPDVILENPFSWLTPRSYQTYNYARKAGVPVVYYDPGDDIPITAKHRLMSLWESPIVRSAAAIITYNEAGKLRFVVKYGFPSERIHVIPKPVDVDVCRYDGDLSETRAAYGAQPGDLVVGYVGRLATYKGSATLFEVARRALSDSRMDGVRFVFVGDTLASMESSDDYRIPNTYVTGMVPHREVPRHLAACDVIVFPDVTRPGAFPTAVAEAMAAGKTMVVGIGERTEFLPLKHGENAWLVPPSDADAVFDAVLELRRSRSLTDSLGRAVALYARENMDYGVVASAYVDILRGVVRV